MKTKKFLALLLVTVLVAAMFTGISFPGAAKEYNRKLTLEPVEATDGFWGSGTETAKAVGASRTGNYLETNGVDDGGNAVFCKNITATNISDYTTDGYLHMWIYIGAGTTQNGGFIDISSGDLSAKNWQIPFTAASLQEGWNELYLPFSSGTAGGTPDFTAINLLRVVIFSVGGNKITGIDDIYVCKEKIDRVPSQSVQLQSCDSASDFWGYTENNIRLVSTGMKEGAGYIAGTATAAKEVSICCGSISQNDLSEYAGGWVSLWIYVDNAANLQKWGQFQLKDSDGTQINAWPISGMELVSGWNKVNLNLNDAATKATSLSGMTNLWLYEYVKADTVIGIDDVRISIDTIPTAAYSHQLLSCDTAAGFWGDGTPAAVTEGMKEGAGYVASTQVSCVSICNASLSINDLSDYENGWISLYIYVDDASKLITTNQDYGQIWLKNSDDTSCFKWDIATKGLQSGWNYVKLNFSDAFSKGDIADIKTFWLFQYVSSSTTIGVDNLRVETNTLPDPEPVMTKVLQACDATTGYWGDTNVRVVTTGMQQGTGYIAADASDGHPASICCNALTQNDLTEYAKGWIDIDVYVSDASKLKTAVPGEGEFWLKKDDTTAYKWSLTNKGLQTGWNTVRLKFSDAYETGDLSNVTTLWLFQYVSSDVTIGIDNVRVATADVTAKYSEQLQACDSTTGYWGNPENNIRVETSGMKEGTGYIAESATSAVTVSICNNALLKNDLSDYEDGWISLYVYVSDAANLQTLNKDYGQFWLKNVDGTTAYKWDIATKGLKTGWNKVKLPFADAFDTCDLSNITELWLYQYVSADTVMGIDDVRVEADTMPDPEPVLTKVLQACDSMNGYWGNTNLRVVTTGMQEGAGYIAADASNGAPASICCSALTQNDLSDFINGWIDIDVYVSDASKLSTATSGDAEFHLQNGASDTTAYKWSLSNKGLQTGWNTVRLKLSDAYATCDLSNMTTLWLYQYVSSDVVIGIDNVRIATPKLPEKPMVNVTYSFDPDVTGTVPENAQYHDESVVTLPACEASKTGYTFSGYCDGYATYPAGYEYTLDGDVTFTGIWHQNGTEAESLYDSAVRLATERSLIFSGSDNMKAAIAKVLQKIENGEEVNVVVFGASITGGAAADPGKEWASVVKNWLYSLNSNAKIHFYNAGIGSTEAVFGVSRLAKDVLSHDPDLVVMDSSGNNNGLPYAQEAYEGEITKFISAGVPVVNFNCVFRAGINVQDNLQTVNEAYGVPQVSFRESYWALTRRQNVPAGLTADEIWSADNVHPNNNGHKLCGNLITNYLNTVYKAYKAGTVTPADLDTTLPTAVTANKYKDAVLFQSTADSNAVSVVEMDGWTADYHAAIYQMNLHGWQSSTENSSITYKVKGGYFAILMAMTKQSGDIEVSVDGGTPTLVTIANNPGDTYMFPYNVIHLGDNGDHLVKVTLKKHAGQTDATWFGICGIAAANLSVQDDSSAAVLPTSFGTKKDVGVGAQQVSGTDEALIIVKNYDAPIDLSAYNPNGYLHIKIYVDDVKKLSGGQIELSSSGTSDQNEASWNLSNLGLVNGWNELYLPIADTRAEGGEMNFAAYNYFRIYALKAAGESMTMKIDDLYFCLPGEDKPITYGSKYSLGLGTQETGGTGDLVIAKFYDTAMDLSKYNPDGFLHIKVYVSKAANLTGGQIELSSAGTADQKELSWNLTELGLVDGWNDLYLPVAGGHYEGGAPDYTKINFFRIYALQNDGASTDLKISDAYMCLIGDGEDVISTGVSNLAMWILTGIVGILSLLLCACGFYFKKKETNC